MSFRIITLIIAILGISVIVEIYSKYTLNINHDLFDQHKAASNSCKIDNTFDSLYSLLSVDFDRHNFNELYESIEHEFRTLYVLGNWKQILEKKELQGRIQQFIKLVENDFEKILSPAEFNLLIGKLYCFHGILTQQTNFFPLYNHEMKVSEKYLKQARSIKHNDWEVHFTLGFLYQHNYQIEYSGPYGGNFSWMSGLNDRSFENWKKALLLDPDDSWFYFYFSGSGSWSDYNHGYLDKIASMKTVDLTSLLGAIALINQNNLKGEYNYHKNNVNLFKDSFKDSPLLELLYFYFWRGYLPLYFPSGSYKEIYYKLLERSFEIDPYNVNLNYILALEMFVEGDSLLATQYYSNAVAQDTAADFWWSRFYTYSQHYDIPKFLDFMIRNLPNKGLPFLQKFRYLTRSSVDRKLLEETNQNLPDELKGEIYGRAGYVENDLDLKIAYLKKAVKYESSRQLYNYLADQYIEKSMPDSALDCFHKKADVNFSFRESERFYKMAKIYLQSWNMVLFDKYFRDYKESVNRGNLKYGYKEIADEFLKLNLTEKAVLYYNYSLKIDSEFLLAREKLDSLKNRLN